MNSKLSRQIAALLCSLSASVISSSASAITITLDGRNGQSTITLSSGDYVSHVVGGAWNAWGGDTGYNTNGDKIGWLHDYGVISSDGQALGTPPSTTFDSSAQAVASASALLTSYSNPVNARYYISDPFPDDNVGSLTISVEKIKDNPFKDHSTSRIRDKLESIFTVLQVFLDPAAVSALVREGTESSNISNFIQRLGQTLESTVGTTISRIAGTATNFLTSLLDPAVYGGINEIAIAIAEKDDELGFIGNRNTRNILQELVSDEERYTGHRKPVIPVLTNGRKNIFDVEVIGGQPVLIDPIIAAGFEYRIGANDPEIFSIIFPYLGPDQDFFDIEILLNDAWTYLDSVSAFEEFIFENPVNAFRVTGINQDLAYSLGHENWVAAVSFAGDGKFTGSVSELSISAVPTPSTILLILSAVFFLFRRRA